MALLLNAIAYVVLDRWWFDRWIRTRWIFFYRATHAARYT